MHHTNQLLGILVPTWPILAGASPQVWGLRVVRFQQRVGPLLLQLRWAVPADRVPSFEQWYDQEHLPDMALVPGILGGRRFRRMDAIWAADTEFQFLTQYQLEDLAALDTPQYRLLVTDPSPRTRETAAGLVISRRMYRDSGAHAEQGGFQSVGSAILVVMSSASTDADPCAAFQNTDDAAWHRPGVIGRRRLRAVPDGSGLPVHPAQAELDTLTIYEIQSAEQPALGDVGWALDPTPSTESVDKKHVQCYSQVFPENGAFEL